MLYDVDFNRALNVQKNFQIIDSLIIKQTKVIGIFNDLSKALDFIRYKCKSFCGSRTKSAYKIKPFKKMSVSIAVCDRMDYLSLIWTQPAAKKLSLPVLAAEDAGLNAGVHKVSTCFTYANSLRRTITLYSLKKNAELISFLAVAKLFNIF